MKRCLFLSVISVLFWSASFSQTIIYIDHTPCTLTSAGYHVPASDGNTETVCQGDTLEIVFQKAAFLGSSSCNSGAGLYLMNTTHNCDPTTNLGECINVNEAILSFDYDGGSILSDEISYDLSAQTSINLNCPISETLTLEVVAMESDTLKVSWQTVKIDNFCDGSTQTVYYDFIGEFFINVVPMPIPVLSTTSFMIQSNDNIELSVNPCADGIRAYIYEECEGFDEGNPIQQPVNCNGTNSILSNINAPDYTTELIYTAVFERYNGCEYDFTYSNPVTIQVIDTTINVGCESLYISEIDELLNDPNLSSNSSYHFYSLYDTVCTSQNSLCNLGTVWNHMKSDIRYQVPTETGLLTNNDLSSLGNEYVFFEGTEPLPQQISIVNCAEINIETNISRLMIKPLIDLISIGSFGSINLCGKSFNTTHDPIIVVVDEGKFCITNYTLPGHIFFPGKVTRSLTEDCDGVYINTIGEGLHLCGNSIEGFGFGKLNEFFGPKLFKDVNEKFKEEF